MSLILVVDDDVNIRDFMRFYLEQEGHEVYEACNGKVAEEICGELAHWNKTPDLVITDIIMPKQGGLKTIDGLSHSYPEMPIVAMSAGNRATFKMASKNVLKKGLKLLVKPFSEFDLIQTVDEYIKH